MSRAIARLLILSLTLQAFQQQVVQAQDDLSAKAVEILKSHCYECHGIRDYAVGLDVANPVSLFASRGAVQKPYIAKGSPKDSLVWRQIAADLMPPEDNEFDIHAMTQEDKDIVKAWIEAGAKFPEGNAVFKRDFVSRLDVLNIIEDDLRRLAGSTECEQTRYFTIANLHNNLTISSEALEYTRAALSKAMNSLSTENMIVPPRIVDADANQVVLAVDLRDYGWDTEMWEFVLKDYPYALEPLERDEYNSYTMVNKYWKKAYQEPSMRVDWFVSHVTRAPMYDKLLFDKDENSENHITTLEKLATSEGVSIAGNFQTQNLLRAGVFASGVSTQNRLVDRHPSRNGYFWISYDFAPNMKKGNISVFPLGPEYTGHPFPDSAFNEAGSEIVYSLPNGLNGYMIVDDKGNRISVAPVSIVSDPINTVDAVPEVVNGLSCMVCHSKGIRPFADKLRESSYTRSGAETNHLDRLFGKEGEMERAVEQDTERFMKAMLLCVKPYFKEKQIQTVDDIAGLQEPCSMVARRYFDDVDAITAAAELGLESAKELVGLRNRALIEKGLAPIAADGIIKRKSWEGVLEDFSIFQGTADELRIGSAAVN